MVVTRDAAIPLLANVTVAGITSTVRGLSTEVGVGAREGLRRECVINCDSLFTLPKSALEAYRGSLGPELILHLDDALRIALDLD